MSHARDEISDRLAAAWSAMLDVLAAARVERTMRDLSDGKPFTARTASRERLDAAITRLDELLAGERFEDIFRLIDPDDDSPTSGAGHSRPPLSSPPTSGAGHSRAPSNPPSPSTLPPSGAGHSGPPLSPPPSSPPGAGHSGPPPSPPHPTPPHPGGRAFQPASSPPTTEEPSP